jgi:outer membrane immunogenic protein
MKTGLAIIGAASVAMLGTPAFAQAAGDGFSGPWVAGVAGLDINKAGSSVDDDVTEDRDESVEGFMYGAALGYDYNMNGIVIGAEAELTDSEADTELDEEDVETFGLGAVDAGRDIYVGARLGYVVAPSTMVYAKAGYTNARYNYLANDGTTDYNVGLDADGYRVGAGVEQKLGTNAFAKVEYRYSNYSEGEIDFETPDVADTDRFDIDTDRHQVVASVGWRF